MQLHFNLLIPLTCALLYVLGGLSVKRAAACGVGVWRTSFLSNWAIVLMVVPVWFLAGGTIHPLADYWQPALTALLYFGGQAFTFLALSRGDVSVTTPVMGTKVVLVALFSTFLHAGAVPVQWWVGAALSTTAILFLHLGDDAKHRNVRQTVLFAFCSAASFGLGDVLLQKWLPGWGAANYFPPMFVLVGVLSCSFIPLFRAPLSALHGVALRWVISGALLMALNNAGVVLAIGLLRSATLVNIIYSVRGLFSVVLVWLVGHWFASDEQHLAGRVLRYRLVGATLMVVAIALVLV